MSHQYHRPVLAFPLLLSVLLAGCRKDPPVIMATAQCHGLTVVTRNVQDFGLLPQVFNPWAL